MEEFSVEIDEQNGRTVLTPHGELDMATAPELEGALLPRLQEGGWAVLDLRRLDFIDSSGLRVIVGAHRVASGGEARFTCVRGESGSTVHRIIEISGIDGIVDMVDDPGELAAS